MYIRTCKKKNFKYLGLLFDSTLSWNHHIDKLASKISQRIGIISRASRYVTPGIANTLYKALVLPIIHYGDVIWSKGNQGNLKRIQRMQNRAGRTILKCHRRTHIEDIHNRLGWLYCKQRIEMNKCIMVGKCIFGQVPVYLRNIFIPADNIHRHNTRNSSQGSLYIHSTNSESSKSKFSYEGAVLWNSLPDVLTNLSTFKEFKQKCKHHFMSKITQ